MSWQTEEDRRTLLRCEHYVYSTVSSIKPVRSLCADNLAVNGQAKPPTASSAEVIRFAGETILHRTHLVFISSAYYAASEIKGHWSDLYGSLHVRRDIMFGTVCHLLWVAIKANLFFHTLNTTTSPLWRFGDSAPSTEYHDLLTCLLLSQLRNRNQQWKYLHCIR